MSQAHHTRPQPANPASDRNRKPPRRAAQACLPCRQRKVRCDVSFRTGNCTNCLLDSLECRVASTRRRRRIPNNELPIRISDNRIIPSISKRWTVLDGIKSVLDASFAGFLDPLPTGDPTAFRGIKSVLDASFAGFLDPLPTGDPTAFRAEDANANRRPHSTRQGADNVPRIEGSTPRNDVGLPDFIEPFKVHGAARLEYLRQQGVFVLPPLEIQQLILDNFDDFIQPTLMLMDVVDFRNAVSGRASRKKVPLLLYHAVMFIGFNGVNTDIIRRLTQTTTEDARNAVYMRAKALFDMDVEKDRSVICQASLMLMGHEHQKDPKDAIYWCGVAIGQAYAMKLHRSELSPPSSSRPNAQRILWWCVLTRECDVSMLGDQPPRVWPSGCPMLAPSDFGLKEESKLSLKAGQCKSSPVFILRCKLCQCIYGILRVIHEQLRPWQGERPASVLHAMRRSMVRSLESWYSEIPHGLRFANIAHYGLHIHFPGPAWALALQEIVYWGAHMLVYWGDFRIETIERKRRDMEVDQESRPYLSHAAKQIARVLEKLVDWKLTRALPPPYRIYIFHAALVLHQDSLSSDPIVRESTRPVFEACYKIMDRIPGLRSSVAEGNRFTRNTTDEQDTQVPEEVVSYFGLANGVSSAVWNTRPSTNAPSREPQEDSETQIYDDNSRLDGNFLGMMREELADWDMDLTQPENRPSWLPKI